MQKARAQRFQPGCRLVGQFQPLAGPAEQHDAEQILQRADLLTDRRRRHRQFVGRARERKMARRRVEHAQGVKGQMRALHR
jgi:hypothetical protein